MGSFILKRWVVSVPGYGTETYEATSRGKAMAEAWRSPAFHHWTFKQFLEKARCWRTHDLPDQFGDPIVVGGRPAFFVSSNRQYVRFVRPGDSSILNAHPYDVEPEHYRPSTYRSQVPA